MIKKTLPSILTILLCIMLLCSCSQITAADSEKLSINYLPLFGHDSTIENIKGFDNVALNYTKAMVYKVEPYEFSKEKCEKMAGLIVNDDITKIESHLNTSIMSFKNGSMVEIDEITGSFQYFSEKYINASYDDEITYRLTDEEYIQKSIDYIKEKGIAFDSLDLDNAAVAPFMTVESIDENGRETEKVRLIGVYFHNKPLDDVEFWGVGPRFVLVFDNSGDIVNIHTAWREFSPYKEYKLINAETIKSRVQEGRYACNTETPGDLTLSKVQLIYITDPLGYKQEYLVPAYKLICMDVNNNEVEVYIQALEDKDFVENQIIETIISSPNSNEDKQKYLDEPFIDEPKSTDPNIEQNGASGATGKTD